MVSYFVGQGVGLVDDIPTCRQVVSASTTAFAEALDEMARLSKTGDRDGDTAERD
ncbi:hypothetical protein [Rhodopila sp.]|uniref:hypothetical protein n=1 Tax=Rhodopila sp. TaxID=2480087 RepID=UPI003D0E1F5C